MKSTSTLGSAFLLGLSLLFEPSARAGWTGQMNGTGFGKSAVNVTSSTGKAGSASNPLALLNPSSAMIPTDGYATGALLPEGASPSTVARIKGSAGYVWSANTYAGGGDRTDNAEIESRITLTPADCASLNMDSSAILGADLKSGIIKVKALATAGTALLLRGIEFLGAGQPTDLADLKANGKLKWELLLQGPFDLTADCDAIVIPFTIDTDIDHFYFVSDGAAASKPFSVTCPTDFTLGCFSTTPASYPLATVVGGCGNVTVTYTPPINQLIAGVNVVTATATDQAYNQVQCTFTVTRDPLTFNGFFSPLDGVGGDCNGALRTIKRGSNIPVKFTTSCDGNVTFAGNQPQFELRKCPNVGLTDSLVEKGPFTSVANEWHYNWDTGKLTPNTTYKLTAVLQDGSRQEIFVKIK